MPRPTPEQLQTALTVADQSRPPHYVAVLAAEVRALQRDLDLFRAASEAAELRIVELRATIARVEALPAQWRVPQDGYLRIRYEGDDFATDLEAALRGDR